MSENSNTFGTFGRQDKLSQIIAVRETLYTDVGNVRALLKENRATLTKEIITATERAVRRASAVLAKIDALTGDSEALSRLQASARNQIQHRGAGIPKDFEKCWRDAIAIMEVLRWQGNLIKQGGR